MRWLVILTCMVGACSHDLSLIPVVDAGVAEDVSSSDAAAPLDAATDVTAPRDAGMADVFDASADNGPNVPPMSVRVSDSFLVYGAAALNSNIIVAGSGTRSEVGTQGVVAHIGRSPWVRSYGGPGTDQLLDVATLPGRIVAVGATRPTAGDNDYGWILELDGFGDVERSTRINGLSASAILHAVTTDISGFVAVGSHGLATGTGIVVVGETTDSNAVAYEINSDFGEVQLFAAAIDGGSVFAGGMVGTSPFLMRMDRDTGSVRWSKRVRHLDLNSIRAITIRESGSLLVGGEGSLLTAVNNVGSLIGSRLTGFNSVLGLAGGVRTDWVNGLVDGVPRAGERAQTEGITDFTDREGTFVPARFGYGLPLLPSGRVQVVLDELDAQIISVYPVNVLGCGAMLGQDFGETGMEPVLADVDATSGVIPGALQVYSVSPASETLVDQTCPAPQAEFDAGL